MSDGSQAKVVYKLILRPLDSPVDEVSRLKQLIKMMLRRFQFRIERIEKVVEGEEARN
jgi:hypothetical protein